MIFEDQQLTYRELNTKANQLARYLHNLGVGPEVLVGICVERSFEMIVGILAILKAGGAYVPLDPSYPKERLAFILEDSRAALLISQSSADRGTAGSQRNGSLFGSRLGRNFDPEPRQSAAFNDPGQSRLCHLHVRIDRNT